jgi:hypothetical protein
MADYNARRDGNLPHYRAENLNYVIDPESWRAYRKRRPTLATRIDGPFAVETREGTLRCEDCWLAIDAHGWPYPIADDEFEAIYEPLSRPGNPEEDS